VQGKLNLENRILSLYPAYPLHNKRFSPIFQNLIEGKRGLLIVDFEMVKIDHQNFLTARLPDRQGSRPHHPASDYVCFDSLPARSRREKCQREGGLGRVCELFGEEMDTILESSN
jgi:hypothetical protein